MLWDHSSLCFQAARVKTKLLENSMKMFWKHSAKPEDIIYESLWEIPMQANNLVVGTLGKGNRVERGDRQIEFVECEKFYVMNLFFKKNQKKKLT